MRLLLTTLFFWCNNDPQGVPWSIAFKLAQRFIAEYP